MIQNVNQDNFIKIFVDKLPYTVLYHTISVLAYMALTLKHFSSAHSKVDHYCFDFHCC